MNGIRNVPYWTTNKMKEKRSYKPEETPDLMVTSRFRPQTTPSVQMTEQQRGGRCRLRQFTRNTNQSRTQPLRPDNQHQFGEWLQSKKMTLHARIPLDRNQKKISILHLVKPNLHLQLKQSENTEMNVSPVSVPGVRSEFPRTQQSEESSKSTTEPDPCSVEEQAQNLPSTQQVSSKRLATRSVTSANQHPKRNSSSDNGNRPKSAPASFFNTDGIELRCKTPSTASKAPFTRSNVSVALEKKKTDMSKFTEQLDNNQRAEAYEQALRYYGWRMQVPGDPLNLKSPFLSKRLSYIVPLHLTKTLPQMPTMRVRNPDTLFQRTINCQPLSFTIHPNWASEAFVAKQNALRSSGQWQFGVHRYAFVY